jgi:hypothetical protein
MCAVRLRLFIFILVPWCKNSSIEQTTKTACVPARHIRGIKIRKVRGCSCKTSVCHFVNVVASGKKMFSIWARL